MKFRSVFIFLLLANMLCLRAMDYKKQEQLNKELFQAVSGHKDLEGRVALLLAKGASPNIHKFDPPLDKAISTQDQKDTPLHLAIRNGHLHSAYFLLLEKAEVNARNIDGSVPLHEALWLPTKKAKLAIMLLLEHHANIDAKDENGNTPLQIAIQAKKLIPAKLLIELKANINTQNKEGNTPLHVAILSDNKPAFRYLLQRGAQRDIQNEQGLTPYDLARKCNNFYYAFLLKEN